MSATTGDRARAVRRARGVRGGGGRPAPRGRCRVGAVGDAVRPAAGAPCWPTFEWRGSSGRHFSSAGPSSRRRHARTHPRLPPVHVSTCCPLELVHQRSNAPPTAQPPGSRNPARFVAGTATLTGDLCRSFREEVSTSRPSVVWDVSDPSFKQRQALFPLPLHGTWGTLSRPQHRQRTRIGGDRARSQLPSGARDRRRTRRRRPLSPRPRATAEAPPPAAAERRGCWGSAGRQASPAPHTTRPWALAGAAMPEHGAE